MPITGLDIDRIVTYTLAGPAQGRTVVDSAIALGNDAGHSMVDAYPWAWAQGGRATLDLTSGQAYIELPADFGEMLGQPVQGTGQLGGFEWTTLANLAELVVEAPLIATNYFFGALTWDQSEDGPPVPRIEVHPTPGETVADALTFYYRRTWTDLPSPADSTEAKIPRYMERAYIAYLKAFARGWEDDLEHPGILDSYLATVMQGTVWLAAVRKDAIQQPNVGVLKNGILSRRSRIWSRFSGMAAPS